MSTVITTFINVNYVHYKRIMLTFIITF